jgi:hypothetical protein
MGRRGPRVNHDFLYVMPAMSLPSGILELVLVVVFVGFCWVVATPHLSFGASPMSCLVLGRMEDHGEGGKEGVATRKESGSAILAVTAL